ncbi:MAG: hypothetical protein ABF377_13160 [Akkermansiaceae bacterium]
MNRIEIQAKGGGRDKGFLNSAMVTVAVEIHNNALINVIHDDVGRCDVAPGSDDVAIRINTVGRSRGKGSP